MPSNEPYFGKQCLATQSGVSRPLALAPAGSLPEMQDLIPHSRQTGLEPKTEQDPQAMCAHIKV